MHLNGIDLWLWLAGLVENTVLIVVLIAYKRARVYPLFTSLIALGIAKTLTLFIVYRHLNAFAYYYTFLGFAAVDYALQIAVVFEIGKHVFRTTVGYREVRSSLFVGGAAALAVAGAVSWVALPASKWLSDTLVIRADLLTAILMAELFVAMLVLSVRYGLPWRTHATKIAQGFGIYSFTCIAVEALHTYFGVKGDSTIYQAVTRIRAGTYILVVLFWIITLRRKGFAEREMPYELQLQLIALQKRASAIVGLLQSWRRA